MRARWRLWLLGLIAVVWCALATWLFVRGARAQGFVDYLDNGNVPSCFIGLVLPGSFLAVWHNREQVKHHRATRDHNEQLHAQTREHVTRLTGGAP